MKKKLAVETVQPTLQLHPQIIVLPLANGDDLYRCPVCGNTEDIDNYDCLGADMDCVFCNQCQTELAL